jgi:hypothetical protein
MIGLLRERENASMACCDVVSVRMVLPMDMKNLVFVNEGPTMRERDCIPKCRTGSKHILAKGSHNPVWPCTISHDVHRTWRSVSSREQLE